MAAIQPANAIVHARLRGLLPKYILPIAIKKVQATISHIRTILTVFILYPKYSVHIDYTDLINNVNHKPYGAVQRIYLHAHVYHHRARDRL